MGCLRVQVLAMLTLGSRITLRVKIRAMLRLRITVRVTVRAILRIRIAVTITMEQEPATHPDSGN